MTPYHKYFFNFGAWAYPGFFWISFRIMTDFFVRLALTFQKIKGGGVSTPKTPMDKGDPSRQPDNVMARKLNSEFLNLF